jgi:hypothetical protein
MSKARNFHMRSFKNLAIDMDNPPLVVTISGNEFPAWPVPGSDVDVIVDLRTLTTGKVNGVKITLPVMYNKCLLEAGIPQDIVDAAEASDPRGVLIMQVPEEKHDESVPLQRATDKAQR